MKVICAWCGVFIKNYRKIVGNEISHGICEKCKKKLLEELKKEVS